MSSRPADAAAVDALVPPGEVLDLTRRLVAVPSFGPEHGWETGVARILDDLLTAAGLAVRRQTVVEGRENVIATLPGAQDAPPLLMLNGHMDTVPPSSSMAHPPFAAEVSDGHLWGRGAADMKGGLAAMAMALVALHRAGVRPPRPLVLTAVAMEEMGNVGTSVLAHTQQDAGAPASFAVVGEPTDLALVTSHKGVDRYRVTVHGRAAHGSTPERGVNAIVRASRLIAALDEDLGQSCRRQSHALLGSPSYNIGTIQGGVSRNTVPDRCAFQIEKRYLPGDDPAQVRAELEAVIAQTLGLDAVELVHETGFDRIPHLPLDIAADHPLVTALADAVEEVTGRRPPAVGWPAFTDGAILQAHGVPAVVCGPGALEMAHADDERVPIAQVYDAMRVYIRLALALCAGARGDGTVPTLTPG
jgi:acetylornithine deacetylase/succinyl-diaminopimelate desuccinylase family protein